MRPPGRDDPVASHLLRVGLDGADESKPGARQRRTLGPDIAHDHHVVVHMQQPHLPLPSLPQPHPSAHQEATPTAPPARRPPLASRSPHLAPVDEHDHAEDGGAQPHAGQVEEDGGAEADAAPDGRQAVAAVHLPALARLHPESLRELPEPVVRRAQQHLVGTAEAGGGGKSVSTARSPLHGFRQGKLPEPVVRRAQQHLAGGDGGKFR